MLKIVICEDNLQHRQELHRLISKIFFDKEDFSVSVYEDGSELLREVEKAPEFFADMIFLDIEMPKVDGIQTARMLREACVRSAIVFVSAHDEFVFQGYEVHAYDYILKPVSEERLRRCLLRFLAERERDLGGYLTVGKRMGGRKIPLSQVRYFVSNRRKITAVLEKPHEPVEFYMQMNELERLLGELEGNHFLRCHQSFLINRYKILHWDSTGINLSDKERIPVSRKYRQNVSERMERQKKCQK